MGTYHHPGLNADLIEALTHRYISIDPFSKEFVRAKDLKRIRKMNGYVSMCI